MNNPTKNLVIRNEDDAWKLLQSWLNGEPLEEVEFIGWPKLNIYLNGGDYHSSLNSGQMAALLDFKKTIARTYSAITHGAYDMRRLREDEDDQLQFNTEVKQGSSIMETDLTPLVQALSSVITTNPGSSLIAGVLIALAFVARPIILKHYEARAKQLDAEERRRLLSFALSQKEQERHETFEKATKKLEAHHPQFAQALPDATHAFWRLASASVNADYMMVAGIKLNQENLQILSERSTRRSADVKQIKKEFYVTGVKKSGASYSVQLDSKDLVLSAIYRLPEFSEAGLKKLMNYMANEKPIKATLLVKSTNGAQMKGRLLRFSQVEPQ